MPRRYVTSSIVPRAKNTGFRFILPASRTNGIINKSAFFVKRELVKMPGPSLFWGNIRELKQRRF